MDVHPGDIIQIDTLLGGVSGMTGVHLIPGDQPALIDCGTQTSTETVRAAVANAGIAPDELAWLVLTHVHLDHCGAVGDLARVFPKASIVVHPRGVRHLVDPARLVHGTHVIYGRLAATIGGLTPVDEHRIIAADDGHGIPIGPGRTLRVVWAPGHARHHMALLDESRGVLFAGDAVGATMGGGAIYPSLPPPEFDVVAAVDTLDTFDQISPTVIYLSHFGDAGDPGAAIDLGRRAQSAMGEAARQSHARAPGDRGALRSAVDAAWPPDSALATPEARIRWLAFGWYDNNMDGLMVMAEREAKVAA